MTRLILVGVLLAAFGLVESGQADASATEPTSISVAGDFEDPAPLQSNCGDGQCQPPEDCNTCPQDCGNCCGNYRCEPPEDCRSCPRDCGPCQ